MAFQYSSTVGSRAAAALAAVGLWAAIVRADGILMKPPQFVRIAVDERILLEGRPAPGQDAILGFLRAGRYGDAAEALQSLTARHPSEWKLWYLTALSHIGQLRIDRACDSMAKCLLLRPDWEEGYRLRGVMLTARYERARYSFRSEGSPSSERELHQIEQSVEPHFRTAVLRFPKRVDFYLDFSYWLETAGRNRESISVLRKALLHWSDNPDVAAQLAWELANSGVDLENARRLVDVARRKYSEEDPDLLDTEAWLEFRLGKYSSAWEAMAKVLAAGSSKPVALYHAAAIQTCLRKPVDAERLLKLSLASGTLFSGWDEATALLRKLDKGGRALENCRAH